MVLRSLVVTVLVVVVGVEVVVTDVAVITATICPSPPLPVATKLITALLR